MKILDRFEAKFIPEPMSGCWLWTAGLNAYGYGAFSKENRVIVGAHRWSYEQWVGSIPAGVLVRHTCDTRSCVNPGHLKLGSHKDNTDDMIRRGRQISGQGKKTHCPLGHPYDYEHRGRRGCLQCRSKASSKSYKRRLSS